MNTDASATQGNPTGTGTSTSNAGKKPIVFYYVRDEKYGTGPEGELLTAIAVQDTHKDSYASINAAYTFRKEVDTRNYERYRKIELNEVCQHSRLGTQSCVDATLKDIQDTSTNDPRFANRFTVEEIRHYGRFRAIQEMLNKGTGGESQKSTVIVGYNSNFYRRPRVGIRYSADEMTKTRVYVHGTNATHDIDKHPSYIYTADEMQDHRTKAMRAAENFHKGIYESDDWLSDAKKLLNPDPKEPDQIGYVRVNEKDIEFLETEIPEFSFLQQIDSIPDGSQTYPGYKYRKRTA